MDAEQTSESPKRTIVQFASRDSLATMTGPILSRLGYRIVSAEEDEAFRQLMPERRVDLLLVDERRLGEVSDTDEGGAHLAGVPIVLLSGKHGATGADPRIVGAVKKPAGLHDLYRLLQQVFEDTPRTTPRVSTHLRVQCETDSAQWDSRMLSISENGCLLRSPESILLGQRIQLEIDLPNQGKVAVEGEAAYQLLPDTGFVFNALDVDSRETLGRFVQDSILAS